MSLFPVYPLFPFALTKGQGSWLYSEEGDRYLDLYGGHAVISVGHGHPHFVDSLKNQIDNLVFYSNSVQNPIQDKLAELLLESSGLHDFRLFLCNSGAEANENALKVASFSTGRNEVLSMKGGFHGRTSGAVAITDNPKIVSPFNANHPVSFIELNDLEAAERELESKKYAAVVVEPIQGVAGIFCASQEFLEGLDTICKKTGTFLIIDEVQSGFGRSGKFFAYQYADIEPEIVCMAKGMGNGFPIGGILIHPKIEASFGMLGTTFGGNHLACAASIAVLEIIKEEDLIENSITLESKIKEVLNEFPEINDIRGKGLMLGFDFSFPIKELRKSLALEEKILVGSAASPNTIRLLPSLSVSIDEIQLFFEALKQQINIKA